MVETNAAENYFAHLLNNEQVKNLSALAFRAYTLALAHVAVCCENVIDWHQLETYAAGSRRVLDELESSGFIAPTVVQQGLPSFVLLVAEHAGERPL